MYHNVCLVLAILFGGKTEGQIWRQMNIDSLSQFSATLNPLQQDRRWSYMWSNLLSVRMLYPLDL